MKLFVIHNQIHVGETTEFKRITSSPVAAVADDEAWLDHVYKVALGPTATHSDSTGRHDQFAAGRLPKSIAYEIVNNPEAKLDRMRSSFQE